MGSGQPPSRYITHILHLSMYSIHTALWGVAFHSKEQEQRTMFRALKVLCCPLMVSFSAGACKAVEQEEEEEAEVVPTAPSPASPPMLPNASAFQMPSPPLTPGTPVTPSAPSPVEGPGSSECVVCMETGVRELLLLNISHKQYNTGYFFRLACTSEVPT